MLHLPAFRGLLNSQLFEFTGELFVDSWDFATVTASGSAPDESVSRAMYRSVASVSDKYQTSNTFVASGDVRHTRPDEEPYGAIDDMRGRRALHFATTVSTAAYLTLTSAALGSFQFSNATSGSPAYIFLAVRLRGGATRLGDGTLWNRNGWRCTVTSDLEQITLTAPAATSNGTTTFSFPQPVEGFARYWMEWVWDGEDWSFKVNGESIVATSATAPVGSLTSDAGSVLTFGGRASNGFEFECDLISMSVGDSQANEISQWRELAPISMSWGTTYHRHLADLARPDGYYEIFQGSDGLGLFVKEVSNLATSGADSWPTAFQRNNTCGLIRISGVCNKKIVGNETGQGIVTREASYGAFINASGAYFACTGGEMRFTHNGDDNNPATNNSRNTLMVGIQGGGPYTYETQHQNEGTPFYILGESPSLFPTILPFYNVILKDCATYFSTDNAMAVYDQVEEVTFINPVMLAPIRNSNHGENPSHAFGTLVAAGGTKVSFVCPIWAQMAQRTPNAFGNLGSSQSPRTSRVSVAGGWVLPPRSTTGAVQTAVFGQPGNSSGASLESAHLALRAYMYDGHNSGTGATRLTDTSAAEDPGLPADTSTLFAVGNYYRLGALTQDAPTLTKVATRPYWAGGERLVPIGVEERKRVHDVLVAKQPAFAQAEYAANKTDTLFYHNQFMTAGHHLSPGGVNGEANIATLNADLNPDTLDWSLPAQAEASPAEYTGVVRPWEEMTNGSELETLVAAGTRVAGETLWPLVAPYILGDGA